MPEVTLDLEAADLFMLAKLLKRKNDKDRKTYAKPEQVARRAELAAQDKGDVAAFQIEKRDRLHDLLYAKAVELRHNAR